ncbi:MAG: hypothetical protein ACREDW_04660 [Aestuariivirgaceae bacterium]
MPLLRAGRRDSRPDEAASSRQRSALVAWERRVSARRWLITDLKLGGQPTQGAESDLRQEQAFLDQLNNHWQTMQELLAPDPHVSKKAARRGDI